VIYTDVAVDLLLILN